MRLTGWRGWRGKEVLTLMSLAALFYPFLKPVLFRLDAETAHEWTTRMMRLSHAWGLLGRVAVPDGAAVRVMGIDFPNRLGLAAGMDKSAEAVDAWGALGFGFVEVGTLTPRPQPGNPKPRLFRLPKKQALINRMGFNNPGIEAAVERLKKRRTKAVVGVNLGKNFDTPNDRATEDYLLGLRAAHGVADYIAVNISSPNTKGLRDLQAEAPVRELVSRVLKERDKLSRESGRSVPVVVKIAPDLEESQIEALARVFNETGVDGVIATNTTLDRRLVSEDPVSREAGGLSGAPLLIRAGEVLSAFRERLRSEIPLIGVGGIVCGADAVEKRNQGAELVQVYSGLVFRGPMLVREISQSLLKP